MADLDKINGVEGLRGTMPIGASLQIGIKKGFQARGIPHEKDRFHLTTVKEVDSVKRHHPSFAMFNTAPTAFRQSIRGVIVHGTQRECFEHSLSMQTFPRNHQGQRSHPQRAPVCKGDGVQAIQWDGAEFQNIKCPGRLCQYQESRDCKIWTRLVFSVRWAEGSKFEKLSTPLVKFASRGYETTSNILGFFQYIDQSAASLGVNEYSLFGFPFTMTLSFRTNPERRSRYPVVSISPETDVFDFLIRQRDRMNLIATPKHEALTDQSQESPEVVYSDVVSVSGPVEGM